MAAAQGHFVHVYVDRSTQRPVEIPSETREALSELDLNRPLNETSATPASTTAPPVSSRRPMLSLRNSTANEVVQTGVEIAHHRGAGRAGAADEVHEQQHRQGRGEDAERDERHGRFGNTGAKADGPARVSASTVAPKPEQTCWPSAIRPGSACLTVRT